MCFIGELYVPMSRQKIIRFATNQKPLNPEGSTKIETKGKHFSTLLQSMRQVIYLSENTRKKKKLVETRA